MQEVYWGCFERGPQGLATPVGVERVGAPAGVLLPASWAGAVLGAGSGFAVYPELRRDPAGWVRSFEAAILPRAHEMARIAVYEVTAGRVLPAEQALPVYLRDEVARARGERSLN
jgi:tRNA threonylcarbamoyladenosine biosynthesis protein TsaB